MDSVNISRSVIMDPTGASLENVAAGGFQDLMRIGPVVTILILVILALGWFIRQMLIDARDERKLNRDALINNTAVISEFKELIRSALQK